MDAGVLVRPPQILFSIPDGRAPLTYDSDTQFQIPPGTSEQPGPTHGDTDSSGGDASVSNGSSTLQKTEAVPGQQATPSRQSLASSFKSTPSPTRVPLTTTAGSVKKLFSTDRVSTLSPRSSLPRFGKSTGIQPLSTLSSLPSSASVSLSSFSQSESVSVSGFSTTPLSSDCARFPGYLCSSPANSTTIGSSTATPTAVPAKFSSLGVQSSSWYLAVIFGTIGGAAFLIFFVTMIVVICRKVKRRRMARNVDVPWAPPPGDEEDGRLFFGSRDLSSGRLNAAINPGPQIGSRGQLRTADNQDAGGPMDKKLGYSLYNHPIPGSRLFSDETPPPKSDKPTLGHHFPLTHPLRFLPSHLVDEELAARAIQGNGSYPISVRPALRKRSRGHLDDTIDDNPYVNPPREHLNPIKTERDMRSKHQPLIDRLRNLGNQDREESQPWNRLPTPGRDQETDDREPWASSFKASLFNAFNALSSGLKTRDSSGENGPDGDILTRVPTRRRPSIRRSCLEPFSVQGSTKSPAWILHEKDDGTGTVQFLPGLEKHDDSTSRKLVTVLSFRSDRTSPSSPDEKRDHRQTKRLIYPRAPFLPANAIVHPHHAKHSPSLTKRNPISRDNSSVYSSTSSLATLKYNPPATASLGGRFAGIPVLDRHSSAPHVDVVVLEPDSWSLHSISR